VEVGIAAGATSLSGLRARLGEERQSFAYLTEASTRQPADTASISRKRRCPDHPVARYRVRPSTLLDSTASADSGTLERPSPWFGVRGGIWRSPG
jgi:hypothetical protein